MKTKTIEKTINEIRTFAIQAFDESYHLYAVTLTYADMVKSKIDGRLYHVNLPNQIEAINVDMNKFKDKFNKDMKKRNIVFKCFFIYSQPDGERPHFHGFIATSKPVKMNKYIKKNWEKGFISDCPKIPNTERLYGWLNYCEFNIRNTEKNYLPKYQIKSASRNSGNGFE